jgi:transcriptional regulator with XRE-family HTH domain
VTSRVKQYTRAAALRPIEDAEIPYLEALGERLKRARCSRDVTQVELGKAAQLSVSTIQRIEAGTRRTRRSTLERIAEALGDPQLADVLADLAGPALSPESPYAERIARRRGRRHRRREAKARWNESRAKTEELDRLWAKLQRQSPEYMRYSRYGGYPSV